MSGTPRGSARDRGPVHSRISCERPRVHNPSAKLSRLEVSGKRHGVKGPASFSVHLRNEHPTSVRLPSGQGVARSLLHISPSHIRQSQGGRSGVHRPEALCLDSAASAYIPRRVKRGHAVRERSEQKIGTPPSGLATEEKTAARSATHLRKRGVIPFLFSCPDAPSPGAHGNFTQRSDTNTRIERGQIARP